MLEQVKSYGGRKTIAVSSSTLGAVLYVVPPGKTFEGWGYAGATGNLAMNGAAIGPAAVVVSVVGSAGDVFTAVAAQPTSLWGTESWA